MWWKMCAALRLPQTYRCWWISTPVGAERSEEHTSELQSRPHLVCRLLLEKKNTLASASFFLVAPSLSFQVLVIGRGMFLFAVLFVILFVLGLRRAFECVRSRAVRLLRLLL